MTQLDDFAVGSDGRSVHLCPRAIETPAAAPADAPRLAGGPLRFSQVEVIARHPRPGAASVIHRATWTVPALLSHCPRLPAATATAIRTRLDRLSAPRPPVAGLAMDRPHIMGVINVTPDSFSDGGDQPVPPLALACARRMIDAGATILDIGGESTRPGADPVPPDTEQARVIPVIDGLVAAGVAGPRPVISIDTRHPATMAAAHAAGADILNDVTALRNHPDSLATAATTGRPVILMHMQGSPRTMQQDPRYDCVLLDVYDHLAARIEACAAAGIPRDRVLVDPGIGFGKTLDHNLLLLRDLALLHGLGCPIVLGASRKSFIGRLSRDEPAKQRLPGSLAAVLAGLRQGAQIVRVHDVAETRQAIRVWLAASGRDPDNPGNG